MRGRFLAIGLISSVAVSLLVGPIQAQLEAQQQATPPSETQQPDAPQPQKKPADKTATTSKAAKADSSSSQNSTDEQNPFPEAVSQKAADEEEGASQSKADPSAQTPKSSAAEDNPFPEGESEKAAQKSTQGAAAGSPPGADNAVPPVPLPPGVSSSQSSSLTDAGGVPKPGQVTDAARAREDTRVGDFYFAQGDWKGAYQRYQDATIYDPTNVDAIFDLAQADLKLKQYAQAQSNYLLYLSIVPNGPKAKQSLKALKSMAEKK